MRNLSALTTALAPFFQKRGVAEWLRRLEECGVPAGPVLDIAQMHGDPQALAREMIVETTHPTAGKVKAIGLPIKFSDTPGGVRKAAPLMGEHTREVLLETGFSDTEIEQMAKQGAIQLTATTKKGASQ
jgi:crotonobetainyl-CoA:carnitine CoA-transferase CaiB-like acyl-CoA transferase